MHAKGSHFCFLASPISVLQCNSSGTGNLSTFHSFNCLIICSTAVIKSLNILLSPQPPPAWKKSILSVLHHCGLFCCFIVKPDYSESSEMLWETVKKVHGPFQSHTSSSLLSVEVYVIPSEHTAAALGLSSWLQPLEIQRYSKGCSMPQRHRKAYCSCSGDAGVPAPMWYIKRDSDASAAL